MKEVMNLKECLCLETAISRNSNRIEIERLNALGRRITEEEMELISKLPTFNSRK